jgi:hypothetical protein
MLYKFLLASSLLFTFGLAAQAKDTIPTDSVTSQTVEHTAPVSTYCIEVVGSMSQLNSAWSVQVQTGNTFLRRTSLKAAVITEFNKTMAFKSLIDALNYFGAFGWQLQQSYVAPAGGGNYATHWILSKTTNSVDDVVRAFQFSTKSK